MSDSHNPFQPPAERDNTGPDRSRLHDLVLLLITGLIVTPVLIAIVGFLFWLAD